MIVETNLVKPRALILGVSGQDGSLLAKLLLDKGYEVWGSTRKVQSQTFENLSKLGIAEQVKVVPWSPSELNSITQIINAIYPDEIYNLSGQSSVGMSFANPAEAFSSVTLATHHLLEASRNHDAPVKYTMHHLASASVTPSKLLLKLPLSILPALTPLPKPVRFYKRQTIEKCLSCFVFQAYYSTMSHHYVRINLFCKK
jgi:nucleoside-diphosphate-sugar epimerase